MQIFAKNYTPTYDTLIPTGKIEPVKGTPYDFTRPTKIGARIGDLKDEPGAGYDVNYVWGIGGHSSKHGGAILPDMMRWLWRDHAVSTEVKDSVERSFNGGKQ